MNGAQAEQVLPSHTTDRSPTAFTLKQEPPVSHLVQLERSENIQLALELVPNARLVITALWLRQQPVMEMSLLPPSYATSGFIAKLALKR